MNTIDLINGVTLISSTQVDTATPWSIPAFLTCGIVALIMFGFVIYYGLKHNDYSAAMVFGATSIAIACACFGFMFKGIRDIKNPDRYKDQYIVTIDENVPMKEFYDNYNIIKVEGEFYTIEEKME